MLVKVWINTKGAKTEDNINPDNFIYAEENRGNKAYQPCIDLYPYKGAEGLQSPKRLNMTLEELGDVKGFIIMPIRNTPTSFEERFIVLSKSAIISTRPHYNTISKEQLYVLYHYGFHKDTVTVYTTEDIASLLANGI